MKLGLKKIFIFLIVATTFSFVGYDVPAPQSLMVTLTGYRDNDNNLKCKLYYMTTLPETTEQIKSVHLVLEKRTEENSNQKISDVIIPFDWTAAQSVKDVVSFYTTSNILYIGIGEFDLLRSYECRISFIDDKGNESKPAIFRK